jgi:hypothetical protein
MRDEQALLQLIASPNTGSLDMRFYDLRLGILNDTVALLMAYLQRGIGSEELAARNWQRGIYHSIIAMLNSGCLICMESKWTNLLY